VTCDVAIRAEKLCKSYSTSAAPVEALRDVSFEVKPGQRVALLGKSGSGKSTLLNLLGGLDRSSSGSLEVAGRPLDRLSSRALSDYRSKAVGMIFQGFNLIASRTAWQNVELPMIFADRSRRQRRIEARDALEAVGLGDRLEHRPAELSGGESQRVAIARALVNRPTILLADEPTGNLDTRTSVEIMAVLQELHRGGMTIVLVTHEPDIAKYSQRTLSFRDGLLLSDEPVHDRLDARAVLEGLTPRRQAA
jgi:putative ABC transport system ATP-binding protein